MTLGRALRLLWHVLGLLLLATAIGYTVALVLGSPEFQKR